MGAENSRSSFELWNEGVPVLSRAARAVRAAVMPAVVSRVDRTSKTDARAFGIDVSRWNGAIDWRAVSGYSPKILYAGIRASVGVNYRDPEFLGHMIAAKSAGIARMPYHYFYPDQSVIAQISLFLDMLSGEKPEIGIVADIEETRGLSYSAAARSCEAFCKGLRDKSGVRVLIYSRKNIIDPLFNGASWLASFDWWVANYLSNGNEHAGPPLMPKGVSAYRFHQTSSSGSIPGVESLDVDHNRFSGGPDDFYRYIGAVPPVPEISDAEKLSRLWESHPELW